MHMLKKDLTINGGTLHYRAKLNREEEDYSAHNESVLSIQWRDVFFAPAKPFCHQHKRGRNWWWHKFSHIRKENVVLLLVKLVRWNRNTPHTCFEEAEKKGVVWNTCLYINRALKIPLLQMPSKTGIHLTVYLTRKHSNLSDQWLKIINEIVRR